MANRDSLKSEKAREYVTLYPGLTSAKIARIMYRENNILFDSAESCRDAIRYVTGKKGEGMRAKLDKDKLHYIEKPKPMNPYALPKSDEQELKPYVLKGVKRALIIADIHIPYHSIESLTATFNFAKKEKPDAVIIDGDAIDCYRISRFLKDPSKKDFASELQVFKEFFEQLKKVFKCRMIYKLGNHELRYNHFLFEKAKELIGVEEFSLENILKARAEGIEMIGDKTIIKLNHLDLLHGHEFGGSFFSPVNVARGLYLRGKVSAMQAHSHKTSEHTETDLHGNIKTTFSIGCQCGLSPEYAPYNSWNNGFAIVDLDENKKDFEVRNKRIHKGKVL